MSEYINRYKNRINLDGRTEKDRIVNQKKQEFERYLVSIPTSEEFTIDNASTIYLGTIQDVTINNKYGDEKYLITRLETPIQIGKIINFVKWDTKSWLVSEFEKDTLNSHNTVKIRPSNYTLKYKLPSNPTITISTPCISLNATLYSLGIQETKIMSLPDGKLSITLPLDENTQQIDRDMRFLHYNHPYKVTFIDYSQNGLIGLILAEVVVDDRDDLINGIAWNDYHAITPTPTPTGILIIDGSNTIIINRTQTYEVKMDDGTVHAATYRFDLSDTSIGVITAVTSMACTIQGLSKGNLVITATDLVSGNTITKNIIVKSLL